MASVLKTNINKHLMGSRLPPLVRRGTVCLIFLPVLSPINTFIKDIPAVKSQFVISVTFSETVTDTI